MEFKINNTEVYGLERAIIASGNPMRTKLASKEFLEESKKWLYEKANFISDFATYQNTYKENIEKNIDNIEYLKEMPEYVLNDTYVSIFLYKDTREIKISYESLESVFYNYPTDILENNQIQLKDGCLLHEYILNSKTKKLNFEYIDGDLLNNTLSNLHEIGKNVKTESKSYLKELLKRVTLLKKLGTTGAGLGEDQALTGTQVQFDIYAPLYMWKEIQRYHFLDFISSQSTMHRLAKFDVKSQCVSDTDPIILNRYQELLDDYNKDEIKNKNKWRTLIASLPSGFVLGATMTTNYRQLKTIYKQRKNHK